MEQQTGEKCACADDLNFGEPQPDCHRCNGTGVVRRPAAEVGPTFNFSRCPRCTSPAPHLHPAMQHEGEVQPCADPFHDQVTPENTAEKIAARHRWLEQQRSGSAP